MKYKLNLIREIQQGQRTAEAIRAKLVGLVAFCYGLLGLAAFYGLLQILSMRSGVVEERARLAQIKAEYQRYQVSSMIVNKSDVELLDRLQDSRIFWTKKLLVMARYLPENYWIKKIDGDRSSYTVDGYGYITEKQQQLMTLHEYLYALRNEKRFTDVYPRVHLNSTIRNDDEARRARVSFSYVGVGGGAK